MYQERAFELHTHLYGCLNQEDLRWLAGRREPRWHIFRNTFRNTYGAEPVLEDIFADHRSQDLRKYSVYESVGNFPEFQCCFDFVISVAHADPEEVYEVARRISRRQAEPWAEYRMLLGPQWALPDFLERVRSICEGFEQESRDSYLAMSLWRGGDLAEEQYAALKELMARSNAVRRRLVAIDFCAKEEGFPPADKASLFRRVARDNSEDPQRALAILYHVGESFQDKSLESAARWVYESAVLGAHRLGHAIALGQDPEEFLGSIRKEILPERIAQLRFERESGLYLAFDADSQYESELDRLQEQSQAWLKEGAPSSGLSETENGMSMGWPQVDIEYNEEHVQRVRHFQDALMDRLKAQNIVLEVCPTSNARIAAVRRHPVHRFLDAGLKVVVGADDPGIFDTTLEKEFQILKEDGLSPELEQMIEQSRQSVSPRMSGRAG
ncbi:MAG: hypothetical protein KDK25_03415 [Leptospiraceae bacterium]|nr:hypothetical protein [Leptospiraceae bacterium]